MKSDQPYAIAQAAMAQLKAAIFMQLKAAGERGLKNSELGRSLGIYTGHVEHEGHISRTLLEIMKAEGVVEQNEQTKVWSLRTY